MVDADKLKTIESVFIALEIKYIFPNDYNPEYCIRRKYLKPMILNDSNRKIKSCSMLKKSTIE
jgi:hypothetical protein